MTIKIIKIALVLASIAACTNIEEKLISTIKKQCVSDQSNDCQIALKELTPFEWQKMYFFKAWTISDSISAILGFVYRGNDVPDDFSRILFVTDEKVVHEEDFSSLDYHNSNVFFKIDDSANRNPPYFTPANALFRVRKEKLKGSCPDCFSYVLVPLKQ